MNLEYHPKHHKKEYQFEAYRWWRTLSINEMKAFEKKHETIYGPAMPCEVAAIYEIESINESAESSIAS